MEREARAMAEKLGLTIDLKKPVGELAIAHRQMIEIAKVLMRIPASWSWMNRRPL